MHHPHDHPVPCPGLIEFGSVDQTAQPYMRPAFEGKKGAARDKIVEIALKRVAKAEAGQ